MTDAELIAAAQQVWGVTTLPFEGKHHPLTMWVFSIRNRCSKKSKANNPLGGLNCRTLIPETWDPHTKDNVLLNTIRNDCRRRMAKAKKEGNTELVRQIKAEERRRSQEARAQRAAEEQDPSVADEHSDGEAEVVYPIVIAPRRKLKAKSISAREELIAAEVQRREDFAASIGFDAEIEVQRRQRQQNINYDLAEVFMS